MKKKKLSKGDGIYGGSGTIPTKPEWWKRIQWKLKKEMKYLPGYILFFVIGVGLLAALVITIIDELK